MAATRATVTALFLTINVSFLEVRSITGATEKYVVPVDSNVVCQSEPCLTFNQYASKPDQYFLSNTIFIFHSGVHQLDNSLRWDNIQNVSFQGVPTNGAVTVSLGPWVSLSWTSCDRIEIDSIKFTLRGNFEYRLMFSDTYNIQLRNITFVGDESFIGCSAVASQSSVINISDTTFVGIRGQFGAALALTSSEATFTGDTSFSNNSAKLGGAIYSLSGRLHFLGTTNFISNTAISNNASIDDDISNCSYPYYDKGIGGAIFGSSSDFIISSCAKFVSNSAGTLGGAIAMVINSTLVIDGSPCFDYNDLSKEQCNKSSPVGALFCRNCVTATVLSDNYSSNLGSGGAIYTQKSTVNIINTTFSYNISPGSGGAVQFNDSVVKLHNVLMAHNSGIYAGAMRVTNGTLATSGANSFHSNTAKKEFGGAIFVDNCGKVRIGDENSFVNNNATDYGGALDIYDVKSLTVSGTNIFENNAAKYGGAISTYGSTVRFCGNISFKNNYATYYGGAVDINNASVHFCGGIFEKCSCIDKDALYDNISNPTSSESCIVFHHNMAKYAGGSILSYDSQINFTGEIQFDCNTAELGVGGAMALYGTTKVILNPRLEASFIKNRAESFGGAIYFDDSLFKLYFVNAGTRGCFLILNTNCCLLNSTQDQFALNFTDNMANKGGTVIYGGQLNNCPHLFRDSGECEGIASIQNCNRSSLKILSDISTIEQDDNSSAIFNSPAAKICICKDNSTSKCDSSIEKQVMPGQSFSIPMVILGQDDNPVKGIILSKDEKFENKYQLSPDFQPTSLSCKNIIYRLYSTINDTIVSYKLFFDGPSQSFELGVQLRITILPCPTGFMLSDKEQQCVCIKALEGFTQDCYIDSQSIRRLSNTFWVAQKADEAHELILHKGSCPLDYCKNEAVNVRLDDPDVQCDDGRTGALCGGCKENFSLALGSLHCLSQCVNGNAYLALIIPFALAGIALVVILFLLRLTIAAGTINGLIFYANIVQANHQAFFPTVMIQKYNPFAVFIAWLNLDLGIEVCFYSGMDIYAYSWLQFLFPFYLWVLIVVIIISCRYSRRVAKSLGQNPVAVLDTLLLMSYSKILKAIIVPLSPTFLVYLPRNYPEKVWLYDASIRYFRDTSHIVLGVFAILALLFLFLPYTFLLLCGQCTDHKEEERYMEGRETEEQGWQKLPTQCD